MNAAECRPEPADAAEVKIVFSGPMGAGKTTAIAAISEVSPVRTEVGNNDRAAFDKDSTTVALDYGQITLGDGTVVRLYGTPGQERFDFMWSILGRGALGVVLLLDASQTEALHQLDRYLEAFADAVRDGALVIGVGRSEQPGALSMHEFSRRVARLDHAVPMFSVDVRRREHVLLLVETLTCLLEATEATEASP